MLNIRTIYICFLGIVFSACHTGLDTKVTCTIDSTDERHCHNFISGSYVNSIRIRIFQKHDSLLYISKELKRGAYNEEQINSIISRIDSLEEECTNNFVCGDFSQNFDIHQALLDSSLTNALGTKSNNGTMHLIYNELVRQPSHYIGLVFSTDFSLDSHSNNSRIKLNLVYDNKVHNVSFLTSSYALMPIMYNNQAFYDYNISSWINELLSELGINCCGDFPSERAFVKTLSDSILLDY